jgi:16S rRNA processing protein RimM
MNSTSQWTLLARILRPQGRKGEVLADLLTDFPDRFAEHPQVWLAPAGFAESTAAPVIGAAPSPSTVISHWLPVGRNAGRIVLHFAGVTSISQAEALAGKEVVVPLAQRMPLEADSLYISELVGCTVYDRDAPLGVVESVQFASTPDGTQRLQDAAPLLVVATADGGELLLPFVKNYLIEIDPEGKIIRMTLPEGLTDLNRPTRRDE